MIANCFFWKWANNDLPGKPTDVCAALLRGELHPAVQPFDARPAIESLPFEDLSINREEYKWDVNKASHSNQAQFVHFTYPRPFEAQKIYHLLADELLPLGICCFDESLGGGNETISGRNYVNKPFQINNVEWQASEIEGEGLPFYAVIHAISIDGEVLVITCGATSVVRKLAVMQQNQWLPAWCKIVKGSKTAGGYEPLDLVKAPQSDIPFAG